jgi:hypothetical protein
MPNIEFESPEANFTPTRSFYAERISKMTKLIMDMGFAKNQAQANMVLIGIAICAFIISVIIIFMTISRNNPDLPSSPSVDISRMEISRLRR